MEELLSALIDILVFCGIIFFVLRRKNQKGEASSMPHEHKKPGKYDTFNKKSVFNTAGSQPHVHEAKKYSSMSDASKLPPGYILLNGEPVRVADLEGK